MRQKKKSQSSFENQQQQTDPYSIGVAKEQGKKIIPEPPTTFQKASQALFVYFKPAILRMFFLGFAAGLPYLLVFGTLSIRLRQVGIEKTEIGYFSWVGLMFSIKVFWSPFVDKLKLPLLTGLLGQRRSWLILGQALIVIGILGLAFTEPKTELPLMVFFAVLTAFGAATQDINVDAFRIETAKVEDQAAMSATFIAGYRAAMIWAGAGVLWLVAQNKVMPVGVYEQAAWQISYIIMACSMAVGVITVLFFSKEPSQTNTVQIDSFSQWLEESILNPFIDFFSRYGAQAALILLLVAFYRISDVVMGIMAGPFYVDMKFTEKEIAYVSKFYGIIMMVVGAFVGGAITKYLGLMRTLFIGALLSAATNLLFSWLATQGHNLLGLIFAISADNLAGGIASVALIAYSSSLINVRYTATQYALFSSLMTLLPKIIAGFSGEFIDAFSYQVFFTLTAVMGIPILFLIVLVAKYVPIEKANK